MTDQDIIGFTADIVSAHVSNNGVAASDLPQLIQSVFKALSCVATPIVTEAVHKEPAVSIRSSVKQDYIVCLEDGAKLKMLKRYLRTRYAMTPEEYRTKWNLPTDYPMVAPAYAEQRRSLAKSIGLGTFRKKASQSGKQIPVEAEAQKPQRKKLGIFAAKAAAAAHLAGRPESAAD